MPGSTVVALVAAGVLAGLLWWSYFDRVQPAFEHRSESLTGGVERGRFVRDIYTYAHIPIVAGIVLIAVTLEYVTLHPTDPIPAAFRTMGAAGFALYFGGMSIGVYRAFRVVAKERLAVVAAIVAISVIGGSVDGIQSCSSDRRDHPDRRSPSNMSESNVRASHRRRPPESRTIRSTV